MHSQEPFPPILEKLLGVGYRVVTGAGLGFACALAILFARTFVWGDLFGTASPDLLSAAYRGALLGAIYYPLAWLTLLEKEKQLNATIAVCIGTIVIGIVGFRFGGAGMTGAAASVGFWGTCAALYQRRHRDRNRADFGSYFR